MLRSFILLVAGNNFVGMDLATHLVEKIDLFSNVFFNHHKSTNYEERLKNTIYKSKQEEKKQAQGKQRILKNIYIAEVN